MTISFVVPFFDKLRGHLADKDTDNTIIMVMKNHILLKLNNRYSASQINFLSFGTLLDIRYKQHVTENNFNMDLFRDYVLSMCKKDTVSDNSIVSQTQEPPRKKQKNNLLEFEDDVVDDTAEAESD